MPHYHEHTRRQPVRPQGAPLSGGSGDGEGYFPPARGSYIRLAPNASAVTDITSDQLQPGDLLLSTTSEAISATIREVTDSPVSHVAVYIGDGEVIEGIGDGVTRHRLTAALADDYYSAAYRVNGLTDADRSALVTWLRGKEGEPYDYGGLIHEITNSDDAWFCSELTFAAYEHIGKPLSTVEPGDSEPGQILTLSNVTYVGHLKRPGYAASHGMHPMQQRGYGHAQDAFAPDESQRDAMITRGYYGQSIDTSALMPADIILTSGNAMVSAAIRTHTGGPASHAALYVGNGQVIEMVGTGARKVPLTTILRDTDFAAAYRVSGLTSAQETTIVNFAEDVVRRGVEYDYWAIASFLTGNDEDRLFCSEMIFEAFDAAGRSLGTPSKSNPSMVINMQGIEYIGHIPANRDNARTQGLAMSMSGGLNAAVSAAVAAGASEQEARAYFGGSMSVSMSASSLKLPDVTFISDSNPLMAGIRTLLGNVLAGTNPGGKMPWDHLFDFCTRYDLCLAIGVHGSVPSGIMENIGVSGGVVVAPNRRAGFYAASSIGGGWVLDAAAGIEFLAVKGGESNFNGQSLVIGGSVDGSEGPGFGLRAILNDSGIIGVVGEINFSLGVPVLSAVEITGAISNTGSWMTTLSAMSLSANDTPGIQAFIRAAIEAGATEQEARAFLNGTSEAQSMGYARAMNNNSLPPYTRITGWKRAALEAAINQAFDPWHMIWSRTVPMSTLLTMQAQAQNVSIGIGVGVNAGLGGSAAAGVGVVFLPNGDLAAYGSFGWGGGWNFSINATYDFTVINGDASQFFGQSLVIGTTVSADLGVSVGAGAQYVMTPDGQHKIGYIVQGSVGVGLPGVSTVEGGLQRVETVAFGMSANGARPMMIGGLPVHRPANVAGHAARPMALAMAVGQRDRIWK